MRPNNWDDNARPDPDAERGENASGEIVPIESVVSAKDSRNLHRQAELSEQIIEERQKRATEPVHMEGLKPLPPEIQKTLPGPGQIPGGPDALGLAPSMRRSIPEPFQRDRIAIDHHGKTWAYGKAETVKLGDIVVDFGLVTGKAFALAREDVGGSADVATDVSVLLTNVAGHTDKFGMFDDLRIFRVHEEENHA
jgi:hypothetical protein